MPKIGVLEVDAETFRGIVGEVFEEARQVRQDAHDTVYEMLSVPATKQELLELVEQMGEEGIPEMIAANPEAALGMLQQLRESLEQKVG